jgi:hypothetical protein
LRREQTSNLPQTEKPNDDRIADGSTVEGNKRPTVAMTVVAMAAMVTVAATSLKNAKFVEVTARRV